MLTLIVPLRLLDRAHTLVRTPAKIQPLVDAYRGPTSGWPPPIPVRVRLGRVVLAGDGNHRLTASRLAGIDDVIVEPERRDYYKVQKLAERARTGAGSPA